MTVLKDAAAAALYGARGANGVILVTTKKGKSGDTQISLDARWGVNSRLVKNYDVLQNANTYMETAYSALYNGYLYNSGYTAERAYQWPIQTCSQSWATKFIPYLMDNILLVGTAS